MSYGTWSAPHRQTLSETPREWRPRARSRSAFHRSDCRSPAHAVGVHLLHPGRSHPRAADESSLCQHGAFAQAALPMSSDEFSGADYDLLVSLLKDQAAIRMGDTSKAQAVKDFAQQRSLQLPAVIEHLMSKQSGVLSFPVLQSLMQPAAPAPAPGPAPTPAPAAVPASTQSAGISNPSAGRSSASGTVQERQKELLSSYAKSAQDKNLAALRGAPDPFDEKGAAATLEAGGPAADQLRVRRKEWLEANKAPEQKPGKGGTQRLPPEKAKLQFTAWLVAPTGEGNPAPLEISSFCTASQKLRESDPVREAVARVLEAHTYDVGVTPLSMDDLVMVAATDNGFAKLDIGEVALASALFRKGTEEREVYLLPASRLKEGRTVVSAHLGGTPKKGRPGETSRGVVGDEGDEGDEGGGAADGQGKKAFNLYYRWLRQQTESTISTQVTSP